MGEEARESDNMAIPLWLSPMLVAVCWACTGASAATPAPAPAPKDAGGGEASSHPPRPDASTPEVDAGSDADTTDRSWLKGDWDKVPGASSRCGVLAARDPGRDVPPLTWNACPSGRAGCELVDVTWTTFTGYTFYAKGPEPVRQDSTGTPYLSYLRVYPKASGSSLLEHAMLVVEPLRGGVPAMAVTSSLAPGSDCSVDVDMTDAGIVQVLYFDGTKQLRFSRADWGSPNVFSAPVDVPYGPMGGTPGPTTGNTSHSLVFTGSPDGWALVDYLGAGVLLPKEGAVRMYFEAPVDLPGGFLARYSKTGTPIVYLKDDGSFAPLLTATGPGRLVTGYAVDRTQGNALVWVEATGLVPSMNPVLYTAPFAAFSAGLAPRRVTAYDEPNGAGGGYMLAAHGTALLRVSNTRALIVRLSDGASWTLDAEPGMGFGAPVWVDDQQVWINTGRLFSDGGLERTTLLRISRSSLGAAAPAL